MVSRHTDKRAGNAHEPPAVPHQLSFLAHAIAEDLIRQGCRKLDASIDRTLHGMGEATQVDHCFLVQPREQDGPFCVTHEWHGRHLGPLGPPPGQAGETFAWLGDRMRRRRIVRIDQVARLRDTDAAGAAELEGLGFGAVLALPLWREETFWGWLTLATVEGEHAWDEASVTALERIACMLAGALEHQRTTRELEDRGAMLEQFGNRLWQLHRVQTRGDRDPAVLLKDYLEAGCSMFSMQTGIVSRIEVDAYIVQALTTDLPGLHQGMTYDVADTYCAEVVRTGSTIAYHRVSDEPEMLGHPLYIALGLEAYISTPITVRGTLYGTLNFSSTEPRPAPFSLQDRELIELMAESIGRFVELRDAEAERDRLVRESSEAEDERRELLQRTEALSSLAVLAAGVAHEINNPLQGMLSHLKAMEAQLPAGAEARQNVEMVEKGIRSIAEIVSKLLALSAESDAHRERAQCAAAADYVCRLLEPQFAMKNVHIENHIDKEGPVLALEQRELIQILTNLLLNARDAMPGGGRVTLDSDQEPGATLLRVHDTGTGIDPAIRAQVFTPFFTTKGCRGTGLGLSVADSIVRKWGGGIEMESEAGRGTTFRLRLPHQGGHEPKGP